jgi:hypothetical protein
MVFDIRFYECPVSCITKRTWSIIKLVNECLDAEGNLIQLPFPGCLTQQPKWFRQAVQVVKTERAEYRARELEKKKKEAKRKGKKNR